MRISSIALLLVLSLGSAAEEEETVLALRYRVLIHQSGLHAAHGAGEWLTELYFPDRGVVCNVEASPAVGEDGSLATEYRMNAFFGPIRDKSADDPKAEPKEQPTREVRVPRALAEKIFELAELTRRQGDLSRRAAAQAREAGAFG